MNANRILLNWLMADWKPIVEAACSCCPAVTLRPLPSLDSWSRIVSATSPLMSRLIQISLYHIPPVPPGRPASGPSPYRWPPYCSLPCPSGLPRDCRPRRQLKLLTADGQPLSRPRKEAVLRLHPPRLPELQVPVIFSGATLGIIYKSTTISCCSLFSQRR